MDYRQALINELSKPLFESNRSRFIENKEVKKEDTEEYLEPRFDSRASFYKKAKVVKKDNGDEELYSYGTHVGGMRNGKPYSKGKWSQTTTRHQKEYFTQKGFDPKEVEVEECKKVEEGEAPLFKKKINKTDIKKVESKNLNEEYYGEGIYGEIEDALSEAGFEISNYRDAGVMTRNLGWIVTQPDTGEEAYLSCDGTFLSEGKKLQETEDVLGKAYDYLDDMGISAADLLVKVSNFFGQDETNEFANELLSELHENKCKKVEGKVISQHISKKAESKK